MGSTSTGQVRVRHRLVAIRAGNGLLILLCPFLCLEFFTIKSEKGVLAGKGKRGRGGAEWTRTNLMSPARPPLAFSPLPHPFPSSWTSPL